MSIPDTIAAEVQQLLQRVAALEAQSRSTLNPNVFHVNADGSVSENLTGHLKAQGVDLDAATSTTPASSDQVRWLRTTDVALVANLEAWTVSGALADFKAQAVDPNDPTTYADLEMIAAFGGNTSVVRANAVVAGVGDQVNIIDESGNSDFARLQQGGQLIIDPLQRIAIPAIPANGTATASFITARPAWTMGVLIGAISDAFLTWTYDYMGTNAWQINLLNLDTVNPSVASAFVGTVIGH